jgi:uncharacterized protein (DUF486 family)
MLKTVALLFASNTFMTMAWYGHLRFKSAPLWIAILASWLIALPEYALQVPANRLGYMGAGLSGYQLKILQEAITLVVFMVFAWLALGETPNWRSGLAFLLILSAVVLVSNGDRVLTR